MPMSRQEGDSAACKQILWTEPTARFLWEPADTKSAVSPRILPRWDRKNVYSATSVLSCPSRGNPSGILLSDEEKDAAPAAFETIEAKGAGFAGLHYRMQLSALDCMGCGNCADICPAKDKALKMVTFDEEVKEASNWEYATTVRKNSCPLSRSRSRQSILHAIL